MAKIKEQIWHNLAVSKLAQALHADLDNGLTEKEVRLRQRFGQNKLPQARPLSKLVVFFNQLRSPLIYILLVAGLVTLVLGEITDSIVILAAVAVNTVFGFVQEVKASNTLQELKKVLRVKAIVIREGREKEIAQENLVVGDVIVLKTGRKVPADARIFESWNLRIREAALTGEWLAAEKGIKVLEPGTPLADRDNMTYMATVVEEGEAKAVVTAIGLKTEIGKVAKLLKETKEEKTPYQKKLARFSKIVGLIIAGIAAAIFVEGLITGKPFLEMFITAVAIAVAAIPEGLPIAMTVILALGMQRILKRKGLVRKLASAETLGSTSIIATDKTLTLTEGRMQMAVVEAMDEKLAMQAAALANEAFIENPKDKPHQWKIIGRPTDRAKIEGALERGIEKVALDKELPKIDEIAFNTENKFIATLHKSAHLKSNLLYVSGAPEKLLALSKRIKGKTKQRLLSKKELSRLNEQLNQMTSQGLRVIALAYKIVQTDKLTKEEVVGLTFVGFIGLKDPLRKEAKEAFRLCQQAGMKPIIVTGDHVLTAKAVAQELGLAVGKENVMLGQDLDKLSDKELSGKLKEINVFARVEPSHKLRIIEAWQAKNKVVAMTGDGINDAPALKKADIGVAIGSGTDVAKDVSDLVLLNDNFSIIVAAVEEGRAILDNIRKIITYLLSDSFTEMILIGVALIAKLPLPIIAVQILWVNLIEDGLPNVALAFEPKEKDLMEQKPISHKAPLLTREMKTIIFIIGFFTDLLLLGLFFWLYNKYGGARMDYIRTMIFAGLTIDSLFYIFSCKSLRKNIWQINIFSNKYLLGAWVFSVFALVGGVYFPPLQTLLKTVAIGFNDWLILLGLGLANLIAIEAAKFYFIVKHQTNV